jgi:hypothetical protein
MDARPDWITRSLFMTEENQKPQLHSSMINSAAKCWRQFVRRYGYLFDIWDKKEIRPPSVAMAIGSSTHKGIEHINNDIMSGDRRFLDDYKDVAVTQVKGLWTEDVHLYNIKKSVARDMAIDVSANLVGKYFEEVAPSVKPIAVEKAFVVVLKDFDFDLAGRIDLEEKNAIRDSKTTAGSIAKDAAQSFQNALYAMYKLIEDDKLPARVVLDYLQYSKTKAGYNYHYKIRDAIPDKSWVMPVYARIKQMAEIITACREGKIDSLNAAPPADPQSWICTTKYCGYAKDCDGWSGREN